MGCTPTLTLRDVPLKESGVMLMIGAFGRSRAARNDLLYRLFVNVIIALSDNKSRNMSWQPRDGESDAVTLR